MIDKAIRLNAFFSGKVQHVNFRTTVKKYADEIGLKGAIWNLQDGRVAMVVEGKKELIEKLLIKVQKEPGRANIAKIEKYYEKATGTYDAFVIKFLENTDKT